MTTPDAPVQILLVEDNPADVRLTLEAIKEAGVPHRLQVAADGVEAMAVLRGASGRPRPDLVLLDLNLPRKDGREVLAEIKSDAALRHIPVIVLTTSRAEQDISHSYNLHANAFITKPVDVGQFFDVVRSIQEFWLQVARLARS